MKRVLRSALDPLPRAISTKALMALVGVVVMGTMAAVYGYLESARPPVRAAGPKRIAERTEVPAVQTTPQTYRTTRARPSEFERAPASSTLEGLLNAAGSAAQGPMSGSASGVTPTFEPTSVQGG
jgi:hypothetical protein